MASPALLEPNAIRELDPESADGLLDRLEAMVPVHASLAVAPVETLREATVFGDTHGDWRCTLSATRRFREDPSRSALIGLGDYIDRPPVDCPEGSVVNALYLLQLAAEFPDRVYLVQGNHETNRRLAVLPHTLPEEIDQLWGPEESRYLRLVRLLERGPLAIVTGNGAYLAHGGFPMQAVSGSFPEEFRQVDDDRLAEIVWGETSVGRSHRNVVPPFDEHDLERFFDRSRTRIFLRGHDPDLTGRPIFRARCLTLHTCRIYERFGGVLAARLPLDREVAGVGDLTIEHLDPEGKRYREPE